ncbi:hypothetical protein AR158_c159L [Paramecium bursaria Chlorella virus AR158]|uniref:hypothetical protein n=1 Tax=Paramecium bursaria Chlorella virus AR158 TaxID=380598 RepID=UPI00015AA817|nr:hypothetical protein AR158_c159L [Paramecium bursaria Chlorella virus AR158]ABU43705.1 hypothetical protein AR158_c159L [Paramecium bursaria Chlorella virus AR158]
MCSWSVFTTCFFTCTFHSCEQYFMSIIIDIIYCSYHFRSFFLSVSFINIFKFPSNLFTIQLTSVPSIMTSTIRYMTLLYTCFIRSICCRIKSKNGIFIRIILIKTNYRIFLR